MYKSAKFLVYFIFFSLSLISFSAQAKLTAQIDRTQINENDSLDYSLIFDQQALGSEPDFSALQKNFSILSKSQSSSLKIINGQSSAYTAWHLTLSPLRTGTLTIPAITFQGQISQPINIQVSDNNQTTADHNNEPLYLTLSASKTSAYVGEQIILTLRIYHRIDILDGNLSDITANNALVQPLNQKKVYTTRVDGVSYEVIEQRYALFAQSSGAQIISPIQLDATVAQPNAQPDDFFARFNTTDQKQIRAHSNKLTLSIKPKPVGYPVSAPWLPTSELQLSSSWNPNTNQLKVGDPITQVITITAKGAQGSSLPELNIAAPEGLKNYPDQPQIKDSATDDGITGKKIQSTAWVAMKSGTLKIPDQQIYWWNTKKDRLEINTIPGQTLQVTAAPGTASTSLNTTPAQATSTKNAMHSLMKSPITANSINQSVDLWKIIAIILAAVVFLLMGSIFYLMKKLDQQKQTPATAQPDEVDSSSAKQLGKAIIKACNDNDAHATKQAINEWIKAYAEQKNISIAEAQAQLETSEFYLRLNELNEHLYAEQQNPWEGKLLKHAFLLLEKELTREKTNQSVKSTHLADLYPK